MRTWKTRLVALFLAGGLAANARGQTKEIVEETEKMLQAMRNSAKVDVDKLVGGTLESQIAAALRNNADIQVAEAKAREAQAEVQRVRVQVANKISRTRSELDAARSDIEMAEAGLKRMKQLAERGNTSVTEVQAAEAMMQKARAAYELKQQDLIGLIGVSRHVPYSVPLSANPFAAPEMPAAKDPVGKATAKQAPKLADMVSAEMRTALVRELAKNLDFDGTLDVKATPELVADILKTPFPIRLLLLNESYKPLKLEKVKKATLLDVLLMMEDECGVEFHVREYGVLMMDADSAPKDPLPLRKLMRELREEKAAAKP